MNIDYILYPSLPEAGVISGMNDLHVKIFEQEDLHTKIKEKSDIVSIVARHEDRIVGYKIGYPIDEETFYSWLGGVDDNYRNQGIASELLNRQHAYLLEAGYKTVRTKTLNKWKDMLILNLKHDFEVKNTYIDKKGQNKIVLEKHLI